MGVCFSSIRVSGSNSSTGGGGGNHNRKENTKPQSRTTAVKSHAPNDPGTKATNENHKAQQKQNKTKDKQNSKRQPCGKRTDFGYEKNFDDRYSLGKLLGHGQFGYTYVGTDKANGDRVAVKRIEKNKV